MNQKDERIWKLWNRGVTDIKTIARKLGMPGNTQRVIDGLERKGISEAARRNAFENQQLVEYMISVLDDLDTKTPE